ncbi:MAG TPA: dihydrofolate reductase family protein [Gaiellaceae bacterium]|nr:dihydrofolate reductase family protein [Gaiellaceae bacterium]
MGQVVVTEFITLDGVIEDPGGAEGGPNGGWAFRFDRGAEGDAFKVKELEDADAQLLGRVTYEGFAKAWPSMRNDAFGEKMNAMPKVVVSTTLTVATWENSTILRTVDGVADLKTQYDGDILVAGSATLAHALFEHDLVDRLHLMVFPLLLGTGKKLFPDAGDVKKFQVTSVQQSAEVAIVTLKRS